MSIRREIGIFATAFFLFTFMWGCGGGGGTVGVGPEKAHAATASYSKDRFLVAHGTGESEPEARDRALAELSRIFESRVESDTYDKVSSVISGGEEKLDSTLESAVRVTSMVELKGVEIGEVTRDKRTGTYRAVAVLERRKARDLWTREMTAIDERAAAELAVADKAGGKLGRYMALRRVARLWIEREGVASRLRVLGYRGTEAPYDTGSVFKRIAGTRAEMAFFVGVEGDAAPSVNEIISGELAKRGFAVTTQKGSADVVISGTVRVAPVKLDNPGWEFARASLSVSVTDAATGLAVVEVEDSKRAGQVSYDEAALRALMGVTRAVASAVAKKLDEVK